MGDLIDRRAAIDALKEHRALFCDNTPDTFSKLSYGEKCRVDELDTAISTLVNLPSAQPTQTDASNTLKALDCVERRTAIDAIANCTNCGDEKTLRAYVLKHNLENGWTGGILDAIDAVGDLPLVMFKPDVPDTNAGECEDAVSRQDAIDALECINGVDEVLKSLPSVTPKPMNNKNDGRWVFWADDPDSNTYECSECHEPYMLVEGTPRDNKYNFCPNCGADMRGEQK